jgi:nitrite reductase (NADH) large subunit
MTNYLIIGNGVAGTTAAEHVRKQDKDGALTILSDEDLPFYYRVRLNEVISGELSEREIVAKQEQWYREQEIDLKLDTRVVDADVSRKVVSTADNREYPYDRLLIATGSHSFIPPIKGAETRGVFALRSIQDARDILSYAGDVRDVVIIGGGLLGLETGNALRMRDKQIMVVEFFPRLLPRQLDPAGAGMLENIMAEMGLSFRLGAKTQEIIGEGRVEGVLLEGGEELRAEMVVISAGVRPNLELAHSLNLDTDKGIKVDNRLRTSQTDVYAAGDVAEFQGVPYGIWTASLDQGKVAGINLAGGEATYHGTTMANTLKVAGVDLASAGDIDADDKLKSRVVSREGVYRKVVIAENQIKGCIMLGDTKGFTKMIKIMSEGQDVSEIEDRLL